jgi:hypothetical protein
MYKYNREHIRRWDFKVGTAGMSEYKNWSRLHIALSTWRYRASVMIFHTLYNKLQGILLNPSNDANIPDDG